VDVPLPHLDTFAAAAESESFTAAAKVLGLTQAAVSQRVQALERALGKSLFDRKGGRVALTEAGRRLYDYARRILDLHHEAQQAITGREAPVVGELLIGASSIPGEHLLPALLAAFRQRCPQVQVRAAIGDSVGIIGQLERGEVSVGLVGRKIDSPHLEYRHLATDRIVLVAPPGHPLSRRKTVTVKQLAAHPLILREAGSGLRHCFEKAVELTGRSPGELRVALELGNNEAIKEAVLCGLGVAVLSEYAVRKEVGAGRLHALAVTDLRCDREMYLVWDRRRALPLTARTFLAFVATNPVPEPDR
jgi:DNA-binding transcriptional LysR family regulator